MKHILVSLVGDQTVPNILAVNHFKPDELLFITSEEMEKKGKTSHALACLTGMGLDYDSRHHKIEIVEDSTLDCHRKLDEWIVGREDCDYTVNLTGGTKIMSISVYDYFKDLESRRMIYIPVGKNEYVTPFSKRTVNRAVPISMRLKVADYLAAYGLTIVNREKLPEYERDAAKRNILSRRMVDHYPKIKNFLVWIGGVLREHRKDKQFHFEGNFTGACGEERVLMEKFHMQYDGCTVSGILNRQDILFLTGGWLEEYCFNQVRSLVGRGIDDVVTGIVLRSGKGTENEFDVMFTRENALYTVECKSLDQNDDKKADALYKTAALQKEFGLRVESFFVSTSPHILRDGMLKPAVAARAEQFRTTVIGADDVKKVSEIIMKKLGTG